MALQKVSWGLMGTLGLHGLCEHLKSIYNVLRDISGFQGPQMGLLTISGGFSMFLGVFHGCFRWSQVFRSVSEAFKRCSM